MDRQSEHQLSTVTAASTQEGDIRARWAWTEPAVWTERMLAALENGVKGSKWFSLIDKVWSEKVLRAAWTRVKGNAGGSGVDGQTVHQFEQQLTERLTYLAELLRTERYVPQPVRRTWIPKPGSQDKRPLGIPAVRDRVVQTALRLVLEPIFERLFAEHSYGFRPGRGCKDALREVDRLLKSGCTWVVDADLKSYFDTIPHDQLMARVEEQVADGRVLSLLRGYLNAKVMDGLAEWTPESGTPQGAVISPLLANLYLNPLDHLLAAKGYRMIRYADDFVILCRSREETESALAVVREWVTGAGLTLHPDKTRIVNTAAGEGFDFLGYHFQRGRHWPREKSAEKVRDALRAKTIRTNGHSLEEIIRQVNATVRGWYGYFKHSPHSTFTALDGWLRHRLRVILLKRRGRSRWYLTPSDHKRWPNAFFTAHGLFSLAAAHASECRSVTRLPIDWRAGCGKSARPVRREG
jgi:RNA-directed DNA polymerase